MTRMPVRYALLLLVTFVSRPAEAEDGASRFVTGPIKTLVTHASGSIDVRLHADMTAVENYFRTSQGSPCYDDGTAASAAFTGLSRLSKDASNRVAATLLTAVRTRRPVQLWLGGCTDRHYVISAVELACD